MLHFKIKLLTYHWEGHQQLVREKMRESWRWENKTNTKWEEQELNLTHIWRPIFLPKIFPKAKLDIPYTAIAHMLLWQRVSPSMELTDLWECYCSMLCINSLFCLNKFFNSWLWLHLQTMTPVWLSSWAFCVVFGHPQIVLRWVSNQIHRCLSRIPSHISESVSWSLSQQICTERKCFMLSLVVPTTLNLVEI